MMSNRWRPTPSDYLGHDDTQMRAAIRFAVRWTLASLVFLVVAAVWAGACGDTIGDTVTCGAPQRILLAAGAPVIAVGAMVAAFFRMLRVWREFGVWWGWQGAGWFLLMIAGVMLFVAAPVIAGPALALLG